MKKFSKEDIDGTRNYFRDQGFEEVEAALGGRRFSYFVLPQGLEPKLEDFVFRATGEPDAGYVFGISDNVREDFRQYAVAHEFIEFTEIGIDSPDRCVRALEEEMKLVPEEIKPEYIAMRRRFFKNLIDYCALKPEYTQGDLEEFRKSINRLDELAA